MRINEHVYLVASGKMGFDWTHPSDCNVYILASEEELALIDAGTGYSVEKIVDQIRTLGYSPEQVTKIFLTHIHADHAGGASQLRKETGAEVFVFEKAFDSLRDGDENAIDLTTAKQFGFYPKDYRFIPCEADYRIKEGDSFRVGNFTLSVLETPGHSRFDLSFVAESEKEKYLFCGDTVFYDGKISMLHTQDFNLQGLAKSIEKLSRLKFDVLLPGHYQPALKHGDTHVGRAHQIFKSMGVPRNIVE